MNRTEEMRIDPGIPFITCSDDDLIDWMRKERQCVGSSSKNSDIIRIMRTVEKCTEVSKPKECHFYKISIYKRIVEEILESIREHIDRSGQNQCKDSLRISSLKYCISNFYSYYVSMQHTHQPLVYLELQLRNVGQCLANTLRYCPVAVTRTLLDILCKVSGISVPDMPRDFISTTLVFEEGDFAWCETGIPLKPVSFYTGWLAPTTAINIFPPLHFPKKEVLNFTIQKKEFEVVREKVKFVIPPVTPKKLRYTPTPRSFAETMIERIFYIRPHVQSFTEEVAEIVPEEVIIHSKKNITYLETKLKPKLQVILIKPKEIVKTAQPHVTESFRFPVFLRTRKRKITPTTVKYGRSPLTPKSFSLIMPVPTRRKITFGPRYPTTKRERIETTMSEQYFTEILRKIYFTEVVGAPYTKIFEIYLRPRPPVQEHITPVPKIDIKVERHSFKMFRPTPILIPVSWRPHHVSQIEKKHTTPVSYERFPVRQKIVTDFIKGTTCKVHIYVPKPHHFGWEEEIKRPELIRIPVPTRRYHRRIKPTTVTYFHHTVAPVSYFDEKPLPITQSDIIVPPRETRHEEYPPTEVYPIRIPLHQFSEFISRRPRPPKPFQVVPQSKKPIREKLPKTTAQLFRYPVKPSRYHDHMIGTTHMEEIEEVRGHHEFEFKPESTVKFRIQARTHTYKEQKVPIPTEAYQWTIPTRVKFLNIPFYTKKFKIPHRVTHHRERVRKPTPLFEYFPAMTKIDRKVMKLPKPITFRRTPATVTPCKEHKTKSTVQYFRFKVNSKVYTRRMPYSTIKIDVEQPKEHYKSRVYPLPHTSKFRRTRPSRHYHESHPTTKTEVFTFKLTPTPHEIEKTMPTTVITRFTPYVAPYSQHKRPTTIGYFRIPLTRKLIKQTKPTISIRLLIHPRPSHFIEELRTKTTASFIRLPVRTQYYEDEQTRTTKKDRHIQPKIRYHRFSMIPQKSTLIHIPHHCKKGAPCEYTDHMTRLTTKIYLKLPVAHDLFEFGMPIASTKIIHRPVRPKHYSEVETDETETEEYKPKRKYDWRTIPPHRPDVFTRRPQTKISKVEWKPTTKVERHRIPVRTQRYKDHLTATTSFVYHKKPHEFHFTERFPMPVTQLIPQRPRPKPTSRQRKTRPTWGYYPIKNFYFSERFPIATTQFIPYQPRGTSYREYWPPYEAEKVHIPVHQKQFGVTYPQFAPRRFTYIARFPSYYTRSWMKSTAKFIHLPVETQAYDRFKPQPTGRTARFRPPVFIVTKYIPFTTQGWQYPMTSPRPGDCHFPLHKKRVITSCYLIKRTKEVCSSEKLRIWNSVISNCVEQKMARRGLAIQKEIVKNNVEVIRHYAIACIRLVGDTSCREHEFSLTRWANFKSIIVVGRFIETAISKTESPIKMNRGIPIEMVKCFQSIEKGVMEECYPSLHKTLEALIIERQKFVKLELIDMKSVSCLRTIIKCEQNVIIDMENLISWVFGTCLPLSEKSQTCKIEREVEDKRHCNGRDTEILKKHIRECRAQSTRYVRDIDYDESISEGSRFKRQAGTLRETEVTEEMAKILEQVENCLDKEGNSCIFTKWDVFEDILSYVLSLVEGASVPGGDNSGNRMGKEGMYRKFDNDTCKDKLTIDNLQQCANQLVSVTSTLQETNVGIDESNMMVVSNCFKDALGTCPEKVTNLLMEILESLMNTDYLSNNHLPDSYRSPFISSIKVGSDVINICEHSTIEPPAPEDVCTPIRHRAGNHEDHPIYIIKKSCTTMDIDKWIERITRCITKNSMQYGLKDPDSLDIYKVADISIQCTDIEGPLECRLVRHDNFRIFANYLLSIVRRMSVQPPGDFCHDSLIVENIGKCIYSLHHFAVLRSKASAIEKEKGKSLKCLSKSLRKCNAIFINKLLDLLEKSLQGGDRDIGDLSFRSYSKCEEVNDAKKWIPYCNPWPGGGGYYPGVTLPDTKHDESQHYPMNRKNFGGRKFYSRDLYDTNSDGRKDVFARDAVDKDYDYIPILEENVHRLNFSEVFGSKRFKRSVGDGI